MAQKATSEFSADAKAFRGLANFEEWLSREQALGMPAKHQAAIRSYANGELPLGSATVALHYLAAHRSAVGLSRVAVGDERGFEELDVGCLYTATTIRLLARAWELDSRPNKRGRFEMSRVAACYMQAVAIGCEEIEASLKRLVVEVEAGSGAANLNELSALSTLMATYVLGRPPSRNGWAPLAHFASATTESSAHLDYDALAAAHIRQAKTEAAADFHGWPGSVVPFELFVIEKRTGVAIPSSTHPLLASPFAKRRNVTRIEPTEDLLQVMGRAAVELQM